MIYEIIYWKRLSN